MKSFLAFLSTRYRAFVSIESWFLIVLGLVMFTVNTPMPNLGWVNLPIAVTVVQAAGLMFMISGFQMMLSMLVWPSIDLATLLDKADDGNQGAALIVAGLLLFNGLSMLSTVIWLVYSIGARIGA